MHHLPSVSFTRWMVELSIGRDLSRYTYPQNREDNISKRMICQGKNTKKKIFLSKKSTYYSSRTKIPPVRFEKFLWYLRGILGLTPENCIIQSLFPCWKSIVSAYFFALLYSKRNLRIAFTNSSMSSRFFFYFFMDCQNLVPSDALPSFIKEGSVL